MDDIKQVILFSSTIITNSIIFIGSMIVVSITNVDFFYNIASITFFISLVIFIMFIITSVNRSYKKSEIKKD